MNNYLSRNNSSSNLGGRENTRNQHQNEDTARPTALNSKIDDLERQLKDLREQSGSYRDAVRKNLNDNRNNRNNNQDQKKMNGNVINSRFIPNRDNNVDNKESYQSNNNSTNHQNEHNSNEKNMRPGQSAQHGESSRNTDDQTTSIGNVEVTEVLDYISTAMQTLGEFEKRFKQRINPMPIPTATL